MYIYLSSSLYVYSLFIDSNLSNDKMQSVESSEKQITQTAKPQETEIAFFKHENK